MSETRKAAKLRIEELVHFFEQNIHQFKAPSFNETQARQQLIDPFFEALGWDITNRDMKPLYLQEVIPEGRVKTSFGKEVREQTAMFDAKETLGKKYKEYASILDYIAEDAYKASAREATKKPDYRFRIKGQTKFFVEAKKPFVDLSRNQDAIFQVKRYGFSGRVPVSILTDFEEFRVFDCTHKPLYEKPTLGVIKEFDLTYTQYRDEFDHLYDTFSREAVDTGSLDTLTKKLLQKKTGDFALDKTFLDDLSKWREELARDIAKHPRNRRTLNDYTLNESVQRILDRIVFFRVCEDREIEVENTLLAVLQMWKSRPGVSLYSLLTQLFQQRRTLYNGLLFSPHECEELEVGDDVLLKILQNLNYPFSPYHFNEIGVEILGSIYEKFLGKTIHLAKKNVIISEKPEVRKAGGVYYTPQYIVNYIVDNTLGKLLYEELIPSVPTSSGHLPLIGGERERVNKLLLSPKQVVKLKIIDIACGSGSFLLGAFQKLIDYHVEWYHQHPKDIQTVNNVPDAYSDVNGNLRLSSRKKRDILVNNIYGVDIDRQAVEVTQMSLYLRVLENENAETLNPQMTLALKEVYLPSLADNIKCGNSLIGTDFGAQGEMFDDGTRMKINPFDWEIEFPKIFSPSTKGRNSDEVGQGIGGFDCVIGNPPYVRPHNLENYAKEYFWEHYKTFVAKSDLYSCFMEKALIITKQNGFLSFIVPQTWTSLESFTSIRKYLIENSKVLKLTQLPKKVFFNATVETCVFVVERNNIDKEKISNIIVESINDKGVKNFVRTFPQLEIKKSHLYNFQLYGKNESNKIFEKLNRVSEPLDKFVNLVYGFKTADDEMFIHRKKKYKESKHFIRSADIGRYTYGKPTEYVWYVPEKMKQHRKTARPGESSRFENEKILVARMGKNLIATYDQGGLYVKDAMLLVKKDDYSLKYILALVNSKLLNYYYREFFVTIDVLKNALLSIPISKIEFSKDSDKKTHEEIVSLVDKMLSLHKQLNESNFDSEKEPIERQIKATDKKIDRLVYQLYGLTEEEIKVVEGEKGESP
jgi:type I restriction-modification system DNA methylase subunit